MALYESGEIKQRGLPDPRLQDDFLRRLRHVLEIKRDQYPTLNDEGQRLVDHTIRAAYWDCVTVEVKRRAEDKLRLYKEKVPQHG